MQQREYKLDMKFMKVSVKQVIQSGKWETAKGEKGKRERGRGEKKLELTACDEPVVGLAWGRNCRLRRWLRAQILEIYNLQANVVHLAPY